MEGDVSSLEFPLQLLHPDSFGSGGGVVHVQVTIVVSLFQGNREEVTALSSGSAGERMEANKTYSGTMRLGGAWPLPS